MKLIFKLVGLIVALAIAAIVGVGIYGYTHRGELVENAIVEATGNENAGSAARKIAIGENLTDTELQELLGVDLSGLELVKKTAADLGIDPNNGQVLREIVTENASKLDDVQEILGRVQSGEIDEDQAAQLLADTLKLPKGTGK